MPVRWIPLPTIFQTFPPLPFRAAHRSQTSACSVRRWASSQEPASKQHAHSEPPIGADRRASGDNLLASSMLFPVPHGALCATSISFVLDTGGDSQRCDQAVCRNKCMYSATTRHRASPPLGPRQTFCMVTHAYARSVVATALRRIFPTRAASSQACRSLTEIPGR